VASIVNAFLSYAVLAQKNCLDLDSSLSHSQPIQTSPIIPNNDGEPDIEQIDSNEEAKENKAPYIQIYIYPKRKKKHVKRNSIPEEGMELRELQQDTDHDKVEQKSKQEKGALDVRMVKEIQPERNIEETENLMSDDVETITASIITDLCDEAFYRCHVKEMNKGDNAANIINEIVTLGDAEKGDEMQTNLKVDYSEDENAIMIDDQLQKDQETTIPLASPDVKEENALLGNASFVEGQPRCKISNCMKILILIATTVILASIIIPLAVTNVEKESFGTPYTCLPGYCSSFYGNSIQGSNNSVAYACAIDPTCTAFRYSSKNGFGYLCNKLERKKRYDDWELCGFWSEN